MSHDPKYLNTINRNTKSIIQIRIRLQIVNNYDFINTYDTINVYDNNNNTTYFYKRIGSSRESAAAPIYTNKSIQINKLK